MGANKRRLEGMLGGSGPTPPAQALQRGTPYPLSTQVAEPELPQLQALSAPLQEIARQYIGARRRSGQALLEMARWLSEGRALAEHGEWYTFLETTGTTQDTAERLLNIHTQAMQNAQFADAVSRNWLSQSAAALLARPSTPAQIVEEVLASPELPKVAAIERKIRQARRDSAAAHEEREGEPQNPQIADFADRVAEQIPQIAGFAQRQEHEQAARELQQAAAILQRLAGAPHTLPRTEGTEQAVEHIHQALLVILGALTEQAQLRVY
jgi:hypothetical protein